MSPACRRPLNSLFEEDLQVRAESTDSNRLKNVEITGRWRSGQSQQTVNLPPNGLRRFEPSPPHQPSLAPGGSARASVGKPVSGLRVLVAGLPAAAAKKRQGASRGGGSNSVVESQPSKLLVAGSIPVSRSRNAGLRAQARASESLVCVELRWGLRPEA